VAVLTFSPGPTDNVSGGPTHHMHHVEGAVGLVGQHDGAVGGLLLHLHNTIQHYTQHTTYTIMLNIRL